MAVPKEKPQNAKLAPVAQATGVSTHLLAAHVLVVALPRFLTPFAQHVAGIKTALQSLLQANNSTVVDE